MKEADCFETNKWILRLCVEQIALSQEFNVILQNIVQKLKETKNNEKVTRDESLFTQILLHVLSRNVRKEITTSQYCPEILREPFVRSLVKDELCSQIFGQMALSIRKSAIVAVYDQGSLQCFATIKHLVQSYLNSYLLQTIETEKGNEKKRVSSEALGWFVVSTLYRRFTSMVLPNERSLGGGGGILGSSRGGNTQLHHDYDHTHRINVTTPHFATRSQKLQDESSVRNITKCTFAATSQPPTEELLSSDSTTTLASHSKNMSIDSSIVEDDATNISSNFFSSDVEKMCTKLQGYTLPESLRRHIWMFCCLHRMWGDPPEGPSCTSELTRLGLMRGMPIESFESHAFSKYDSANDTAVRQAIAELTRATVAKVYLDGFGIRHSTFSSSKLRDKDSRPGSSASQLNLKDKGALSASSFTPSVSTTSPAPLSFLDKAHTHYVSCCRAKENPALSASASASAGINLTEALPLADEVDSVVSEKTLDSMDSMFFKQEKQQPLPIPPQSADAALLRRAEVLLRAVYILTGEVTKRGAAVALMILITFPDASPVSEKILKLFKHVHEECLPSEQMHHSYSILSTAKSTFSILLKEEPILHAHIQKLFDHSLAMTSETPLESGTEQMEGLPKADVGTATPIRPPLPAGAPSASYVLLQPWLETGFVGYVSEFTAMYIWDQCFMFGGRATDWRKILPVICFTLIKILKTEIMMEVTLEKLKLVLTKNSKRIRTKIFSTLLRHRIADLPRKKWFASPFSDTSLTLDKIRAVVMLQKLGRGRVDRRRVQDMINAKREEKARQETAEREAVQDWKAEIERQAEEWRAEFIRKKEEEEALEALTLRVTMEYMIQKILVDCGSLPERTLKPKVKSAYQIEWERLNSMESGDESSDAGNKTNRDSARDNDKKVDKESIDDGVSNEIAASTIEDMLINAFSIIEVNEQKLKETSTREEAERQSAIEQKEREVAIAEENERRKTTEAAISDIVTKIEVNSAKELAKSEAAAKVKAEAEAEIELVKEKEALEISEKKHVRETVGSMIKEMISQLESKSAETTVEESTGGDKEFVLSSVVPESTVESKKDTEQEPSATKEAQLSPDELASIEFRATLPPVEVDAVVGFFEDQRSAIMVLREEKSRLKSLIAKNKKKFQKKHGRVPKWNERQGTMKQHYEDYQEVSFNLKTFTAKLRQDEDALLKKWQQKKKPKRESDV